MAGRSARQARRGARRDRRAGEPAADRRRRRRSGLARRPWSRRAKAIITTVGPYQLYGSPLVAACAAAGTDYVDLTGESHWIAADDRAPTRRRRRRLARGSCSPAASTPSPSTSASFFVEEEAKRRFGAYAPRVRGRVRGMKGGLSGGTLASGMATMAAQQKDPGIGAVLANPFALTPGFTGADQPDGDTPLRRQGRRLLGRAVHDGRDQHQGGAPLQLPAGPPLGPRTSSTTRC